MHIIHKAAGILIKDRKLLVEKSHNKQIFIAPGGSIEVWETPKMALARELLEEFQIHTKEEDFQEFGVFEAKAAGQEDKMVIMNVFLVTQREWEPTPDNEVETILWVSSRIPDDIQIGSIFLHEVIPKLKEMDLID
jgi:8-oxo-dGTP diphosphatase